nr:ASKHA domain-containing protein [uncultured Lachnoclostridium sp.]
MKLTVISKDGQQVISMREGLSVLQALTENKIYVTSPCGGKGICGKCKIRLVKGTLPVTEADRRILTKEQIELGIRLGCRAYLTEDATIEVEKEEEFQVVMNAMEVSENIKQNEDAQYGIAIDIGTTTIAMEVVDVKNKVIQNSYGELNRQRSYGADVISRISACNAGDLEKLRDTIRNQLREMIQRFELHSISKIAISANTTMCHILMGYPCETLGVYPFEPVNVNTIRTNSQDLFGDSIPFCQVVILPGISTFVGADIVSGLVSCGFSETEKVSVLIDLGTNGEMAIGTKNQILVTSAAAGPAFEGGNISCGTGSIPGAISSVEIQYGMAKVRTIQDKDPVGLCGSGVLELTAELLSNELIDETGALDERYFEEGFPVALSNKGEVVFTQRDIREIQMAKSAVYSAATLMTRRYGVKIDDVDKVYLAGGFGFHVNIEKAIAIGLLPKQWKEKITVVGNASLRGAELALVEDDFIRKAEAVVEVASVLALANDKDFSELYTENMFFE